MRLYHGSNIEIESIDINKCRPYKDFGQGFYLTTLEPQAILMAKRTTRKFFGRPTVTAYEFDDAALQRSDLAIKVFDRPTAEWALFVLNNRDRKCDHDSDCNHDCKYDIVVGPVADDDIAFLFRTFSRGLIDVDALVRGMEYKNLNNQYSFHTEEAISCLRKVGAELYE